MKKFLGLAFLILNSPLFADVVSKIEYEGLDRVEVDAIKDCVTIVPHRPYSQKDIDDSLKALFKKDFFSYVRFVKRGDTLVVCCTEKPIIDKVAFEGNDAASEEMLKNIVNDRIGEGKLYNLHIIKDVLSDIQLAYKSIGYFSAIITPKVIKHPGNRIDLVFEIQEGERTSIKKIIFVGNKQFSDDELKDLLSIKEKKVWRFWDGDSHIFRPDKVEVDIDHLTKFYRNNGYPFFIVTSTSAELDYDKTAHYCTFTLEEGDLYKIGNISVESRVEKIISDSPELMQLNNGNPKKVFSADKFPSFIDLKSGTVFNESAINENKDRIRRELALQDNPFIDVVEQIEYDKEKKIAHIKYIVQNSPHAFIERIDIIGNSRTLDRVIRREFSIHEGDAFNMYKIQHTVERLKGLEYFDDVQVNDIAGSAEDKRVLQVTVKEKDSTAQMRFGLSVSDADGFGGFVGLVENNLFGTGRSLAVEGYWAQKLYGLKFDIYEPRFMDKSFGAGLAVGANNYDRKKYNESVLRSIFVAPYIRYAITKNLYHKISYSISMNSRCWWDRENNKLYDNVPDHAWYIPPIMRDEYGKYTTFELGSVLHYVKVDNPYRPRSGYELAISNAYAGLGGGVRYFKNELSGTYFYPLSERFTFIADAKVGYIKEIRNTRSLNRYALGGDGQDMRGFDSFGVGPKDMRGNSIGGNKFWTLSFKVKTPLSTREMGMNGVAFLDFGSAWGSKYDRTLIRDSSAIRASVGVAIEWEHSPLGMPMAFIFGFPLKKKSFDDTQTFTLTGLM